MFDNEIPIDDESDENKNISNSEDVTDIIDNQNANQSTSIQDEDCHHNN